MSKFTDEQKKRIGGGFSLIEDAIQRFGSALNAYDLGFGEAMDVLEKEGHDLIRMAFERAPELHELLPETSAVLLADGNLADSGWTMSAEIKSAREKLA